MTHRSPHPCFQGRPANPCNRLRFFSQFCCAPSKISPFRWGSRLPVWVPDGVFRAELTHRTSLPRPSPLLGAESAESLCIRNNFEFRARGWRHIPLPMQAWETHTACQKPSPNPIEINKLSANSARRDETGCVT